MRWIAFRDQPGALVDPQLAGSLPIGTSWRGVCPSPDLSLDEVERLVSDAAGRMRAALALWRCDGYLYGFARLTDGDPIPFLLNADESLLEDEDVRTRCAIGPSVTRWRQRTAQSLSDFSTRTPRTADPLEIDAMLQSHGEDDAIEASWCELLGLAVPIPRAPEDIDEAETARAALALAAERRRQRRRSPEFLW